MNRPAGGNSTGGVARDASSAVAKGALLIGLAVVVGVVLLQLADDGESALSAKPTPTKPATTSTVASETTTTTTLPAAPPKTPDQLRVIVLNGGAPAGKAASVSASLKQSNYTNQATANNWPERGQKGSAVLCKPALQREAVALAVAVKDVVGSDPKVEDYPAAPPTAVTDDIDCIVVVGS